MKLTRLFTGLAAALATAMFIGLAAPAAIAEDNPAATPAAPAATPAAPAATTAAPAATAPAAARGSGSPRRAAELLRHGPRKVHQQFRRHGVAFDLGRARFDDDHPWPRALLWRHGRQEERRRHRDDELRHHGAGHSDLLRPHLQPRVHRRQRIHRRLLSGLSPGNPLRLGERGEHAQPAGADDP